MLTSLLLCMALTGFSFMILEIVVLRELLITLGGSINASSATLAAVMFGLFLGSQIFGRLCGRWKRIKLLLIGMQFALALSAMTLVLALRAIGLADAWWLRYGLSFCVILIPSLLAGGQLPVAMQYAEPIIAKGKTGFYTGSIYGADALGAVLGSLTFPFLILPYTGILRGSFVAATADVLGCVILALWASNKTKLVRFSLLSAPMAILLASLFLNAGWADRASASWAMGIWYPPLAASSHHYVKDTPYQKIQVLEGFTDDGRPGTRVLYLDGITQSTSPQSPRLREFVFLALLAHPNPKHILLIGCGDGNLLVSLLADRRVKDIDQVELDREVIETAKSRLPGLNRYNAKIVWDDPRIHLHIGDGHKFLRDSSVRYDVIIVDINNASTEAGSIFYSKEFMRLAKDHLADTGIFLTHVTRFERQNNDLKPGLAALLIAARTAQTAFNDKVFLFEPRLWPIKKQPEDWTENPFLMASNGPLHFTEQKIRERIQFFSPQPEWMTPGLFLRWMHNSSIPEGIEGFSISTDDNPAILFPQRWARSNVIDKILRLDD
ncbi:MAG: hypothetical protein AABZ44_00065 [Elusimicrobiota bacterium]